MWYILYVGYIVIGEKHGVLICFVQQVVTSGKNGRGYHYILANLVSVSVYTHIETQTM